jgi:3-methylcrotonyl-CoA carboxylase beta subunit
MRQRIPIVYLVDSAGVNLPYQEGVFPGQYGAARIFYYNSIMRRYLQVPQISAVMGSCVAGGAYLPALSDVIFMVDGTSFMGLGGPNLVKGATGQTIDSETLGGAKTHTEVSAVAHYRAANDTECLSRIREYIGRLPRRQGIQHQLRPPREPARSPSELYDVLPQDHRLSYNMRQILACLLDAGALDEFQPDVAREMICGHAHIEGHPVALIANQRGIVKGKPGERPKFGGIVYTGCAE